MWLNHSHLWIPDEAYTNYSMHIPHIYCSYGWNVPTELGVVMQINDKGDGTYQLEGTKMCMDRGDVLLHGKSGGDGTVPHESLAFCRQLTPSAELRFHEVDCPQYGGHVSVLWDPEHTLKPLLLYATDLFDLTDSNTRPGQLQRVASIAQYTHRTAVTGLQHFRQHAEQTQQREHNVVQHQRDSSVLDAAVDVEQQQQQSRARHELDERSMTAEEVGWWTKLFRDPFPAPHQQQPYPTAAYDPELAPRRSRPFPRPAELIQDDLPGQPARAPVLIQEAVMLPTDY